MGKSVFAILSLSLAVGFVPATPVAAQSPSFFNKLIANYCKREYDGGSGVTQGTCIAYYQAFGPVGFCAAIDKEGALPEYGFSNTGDCVKALMADYPRPNT